MSYNILLVDDDANQSQIIEQVIQDKMHYNTRLVENGQDAVDIITSDDKNEIDLVILDLSMPGMDGIEVINAIKPVKPDLPIIVRTGHDDLDMIVSAMKAGATDFIKKLDDSEKLKELINKSIRAHVLHDELSLLRRSQDRGISFQDIIGSSPLINEMIAMGEKVALSNIPVLLEGESGSGKELMARSIHSASKRKDKPFIAVNCGAIPANLVESILFGHEKGAFTGAVYKTFGKFREAAGGTIFLDEIGELPLDIQVKLLRVLQDGEIDPVGSKIATKVDVRIISATNRNLTEEVRNSNFREDLFYRLNVFPIHVPSLRERNGDVGALIKYFISSFAASESKDIWGLSKDAEELLCNYSWPGNIRQLKNTIFRAVVLCDSNELKIIDFPQVSSAEGNPHELNISSDGAISLQKNALALQDEAGNIKSLSDLEKEIIEFALDHYNGHMSEVSRRLMIGRSTLYRKLSEYDIEH